MLPFATIVALLAGAFSVLANPIQRRSCNVTGAQPLLPIDQTNITVPEDQTAIMTALGVGFANYTCSSDGTYSLFGLVATLFDTSCLYGSKAYSRITVDAYKVWNSTNETDVSKAEDYFPSYQVWADHYWQTNSTGYRNPVFDARARAYKGDPNAYVVAQVTGRLSSPTGKQDIDWYRLENIEGDLAQTIIRADTKYGKPPSSCDPATEKNISVKYTCDYYFYE